MMASRGMGDINPSKMPGAKKKKRRDDTDFTQYKKGGEVWDQPRPEGLGSPKKLSPAKKTAAKAFAKRTGTKYPSLVANMQGAKHGRKS
jgi:hypothetical protein